MNVRNVSAALVWVGSVLRRKAVVIFISKPQLRYETQIISGTAICSQKYYTTTIRAELSHRPSRPRDDGPTPLQIKKIYYRL